MACWNASPKGRSIDSWLFLIALVSHDIVGLSERFSLGVVFGLVTVRSLVAMVSGIETRRGVLFTLITPSITSFLPFLAAAPIYSLSSRTGPLKMNAFSKGKDSLNQLKDCVVTVGRRGTVTMAIVPGLGMAAKAGRTTLATAVAVETFVFGPSHAKGPENLRRVAKEAMFDSSGQHCHHKETDGDDNQDEDDDDEEDDEDT